MINDNCKTVAVELGILQCLYRHDATCQGIVKDIIDGSEQHVDADASDVISLINRYIDDGHVTERSVVRDGVRYLYYHLTQQGAAYLLACLDEYHRYGYGVNQMLQSLRSPDGGSRKPKPITTIKTQAG